MEAQSNQTEDYIHGYTVEEQQRLIQQARYWRERLILRDVNFLPGDRILEIGCGAGAVLGVLGQAFPQLQLAGIDLQASQIAYARQHLENLGLSNVDLQVGDAAQLPWTDESFNHIYSIWFLEHTFNPEIILQEAYRVLKPGGTIRLNETDYPTILVYPESVDYRYLQDSLCELLLDSGGNPYIGRRLGLLLQKAGFSRVKNSPWAFHYFQGKNSQELRDFIEYIYAWLAPTIPQITEKLGKDEKRLRSGLEFFCSIPDLPESSVSIVVYRASAIKLVSR
jgi:ubiquinone/menaquinone biosynthesis C-methylase UbiE